MAGRILVTGMGVVSAIGNGVGENLSSLKSCRSGIAEVRYLQSGLRLPVGEVKLGNSEMRAMLGIEDAGVSRTSLLGIIALKEALGMADVSDTSSIPLISGTTVGGMDIGETVFGKDQSGRMMDPDSVDNFGCGPSTQAMADWFGGFEFATTLSTACSSAANAIILAANLIKAGRAEVVVAGGSESLSNYHYNGFNSLMILDSQPCRPFDAGRAGLNLGEGAAFLVLESESHASARGAKALASLAGYGNACDAFHQTASSPDGDGAFLAMSKALRMAGMEAADIDYINAHGTGTPNNDASESAAIRRVFGAAYPPVSSTKGFTGHTTSASGSIESVFSILAINEGFIPCSLNWKTADEACIVPSCGKFGVKIETAMCNAFGFGGNDSSLIFSKI